MGEKCDLIWGRIQVRGAERCKAGDRNDNMDDRKIM